MENIMENKPPTTLDILNMLIVVAETNLKQAHKDCVDMQELFVLRKESSDNMVTFHLLLRDLLNDLTRTAAIRERIITFEYLIKLLNELKESCRVDNVVTKDPS